MPYEANQARRHDSQGALQGNQLAGVRQGAPTPRQLDGVGNAGSLGGLAPTQDGPAGPVAFVLSSAMAFAYWLSHAPRNLFPALNGGDAAILYRFVFLYMAAAGGGEWSLDRARERRSPGIG
jgi:hypothetical protein